MECFSKLRKCQEIGCGRNRYMWDELGEQSRWIWAWDIYQMFTKKKLHWKVTGWKHETCLHKVCIYHYRALFDILLFTLNSKIAWTNNGKNNDHRLASSKYRFEARLWRHRSCKDSKTSKDSVYNMNQADKYQPPRRGRINWPFIIVRPKCPKYIFVDFNSSH